MTSMRDILEDARKLSRRLRSHDAALDKLIGSAEDNFKRIQALKQYQVAQDKLNSVGPMKLRTQIVLDLQKENHHIRELQQENMELRAALEDHQKATELIMSKYRQHLSHLVNSSKIDTCLIQVPQPGHNIQDRDDKICEMASVMNYAIVIDEENQNREHEFVSKLVTENKGLRELLEISRCNGSLKDPLIKPKMVSRLSQTDVLLLSAENGRSLEEDNRTEGNSDQDSDEEQNQLCSSTDSTASSSSITSILVSPIAPQQLVNSDESGDEDHVVYSTIKKTKKRPSIVSISSSSNHESHKVANGGEGGSDGNASSSPDVEEEIHDDTLISDSSSKFLETRVLLSTPDGAVCQN